MCRTASPGAAAKRAPTHRASVVGKAARARQERKGTHRDRVSNLKLAQREGNAVAERFADKVRAHFAVWVVTTPTESFARRPSVCRFPGKNESIHFLTCPGCSDSHADLTLVTCYAPVLITVAKFQLVSIHPILICYSLGERDNHTTWRHVRSTTQNWRPQMTYGASNSRSKDTVLRCRTRMRTNQTTFEHPYPGQLTSPSTFRG